MQNLSELLKKADTIFAKNKKTFEKNLSKIKQIENEEDLRQLNGKEKTENRLDIAYSTSPPIDPLERLIGKNNLMDVVYFQRGLEVAKTVCRIVYFRGEECHAIGTGFMVSPTLMMTNNHVISSKYAAKQYMAEFDYAKDTKGLLPPTAIFELKPDTFFITNTTLDYTVVAVSPIAKNQAQKELKDYGYNRLTSYGEQKILEGEAVSIIQHPEGLPKMIAIRDNTVVSIHSPYVHYTTDTQKGSSGSLVANDQWQVVALHRSGVAEKDDQGRYILTKGGVYQSEKDKPFIKWVANQGVLMDFILEDLMKKTVKGEEKERLKKELLGG